VPLGLPERYQRVVDTIGAEQRARLLRPLLEGPLADTECFSDIVALPSRALIPDRLNWLLASLTRRWLPDDLLMKVDKTTMAVGLEARTPFLDHRLFEFAAALPTGSRLRGLKEKEILRRWARRILPERVSGRGKQPYRAPDAPSFFGPNAPEYIADALSSASLQENGVFSPTAVAGLVRRCQSGRATGVRENQALVAVLSTQLWHDQFVARPVNPRMLDIDAADVVLQDAIPSVSRTPFQSPVTVS
jgi:asparagine synthetase B (glutamine-hydrolysing)